MTVSIGSSTKLNSIAGVSQVLQLTNSEKISLANKILPPNILVRDDAGVLYMTDGINPVSALEPIEALASYDSNGNNIISTYATKSELGGKADSADLTNHTGNTDIHVTANDKSNWNAKQDALTIETSLNKNSTNLLTNGAIATALEDKLDATGVAASATKLETSRNINGTAFNGTSAITTAKWGTSRTITVTDSTSTHSTTTSTDGSANFTLTLPGTIDADITGNAATATNATNNANGKALTDTIIKGLSVNGQTVTYTMIDGTTGTITTQDTNTDTKVTQSVSTDNKTFPILLCNTEDATADVGAAGAKFASGVKVNPSTNTISATFSGNLTGNVTGNVSGSSGSCSGNASTATQFSSNADVTLTGDVTGTASSKKGWSITTTLADSGVTQGTYGPSANVTGSNGTTISVPEITVDAKGRITSITNRTYTSVDNDTTYSAMTDAEATTGTDTTPRSISAKVLNDKISSMIPDNVAAITSAEITELVSQKLSPTPTRDGAMWMDSNYTMFVNEYNRG